MKIFRSLLLVVAVALSSHAWALNSNSVSSAGFDKLSDTEKAEIIKIVADKANNAQNPNSMVPSPEKVGQWLDLGPKIGQMIGGAAKEVGIAVNDFVKTPVGQLTMLLIIWKLIGASLVHILGAFTVLIVGSWALRKYAAPERTVEYDVDKVDIFKRSRIKRVRQESSTGDALFFRIIAQAAILGAFVVIMLTGI